MAKNTKKTSASVSSLASEVLSKSSSSNIAKTLAASVLSQRSPNKQTGPVIEEIASKVLSSEKYSETTKTLAGSALSQSNRDR